MNLVHNNKTILINRDNVQRLAQIFFRVLVVVLGIIHTWAAVNSHSMNADGISYLDMGDAYLLGEWDKAINPIWSPMYSWVLGLVMFIFKPSMRWEFPAVHIVNFVIYLVAFICFEFLWRSLWNYQHIKFGRKSFINTESLPEWAWYSIGYTLFIWTSLALIEIWAVTPDMLMAALVYLASGLLVRIRSGQINWFMFSVLGLVLGLGYLTKTIMLPIALIFFIVTLFSVGDLRQGLTRTLLSFLIFLLVISPYIALLSRAKGYLTYGEVGKLTFVRHVNGVKYPHWQGEPPGNGYPKHPSRQILEQPPIYEFGSPIEGTYPISYDQTYWYEGVKPQFNLQQIVQAIIANLLFYADLLFRQLGVVFVGITLLYMFGKWTSIRVVELIHDWGLAIIAVITFGLYSLVYVEGRYIAVFVTLLCGDLLANVQFSNSKIPRRMVAFVSVLVILFVSVSIFIFNLEGFSAFSARVGVVTQENPNGRPPSWPGEVAEELFRHGVQPGDKIAIIGYGFDAFWARLARLKIVAELLSTDADPFWMGDLSVQAQVVSAFKESGADAIIAEKVPSYATLHGWQQLGETNYYVYSFVK